MNNLKNLGRGAKSTLNKGKRAFTFVEVILVMALISFLYVVTTKVIQHNLEKKVPIYVYYLYKNLENEGKLLTKDLKDKPENTGKPIDKILADMTVKEYCEEFSKDINTVGGVDCENIEQKDTQEEEIITHHSSQRNVTSQNTINLSIDDTGRINTINDNTYMILDGKLYFIDQSNKYEITNITFDDNGNLIGKKNNIIDTIIPASQLNTTIETKEPYTEVTNNSTTFDLSKKPQNKNFTSINNIDIAFVSNKKNVTKKEQNCICASNFNIALTINMPEIGNHRDDKIKNSIPKYPTIFNIRYVAEMIARSFEQQLNVLTTPITIDNQTVKNPKNNLEAHIIKRSNFITDYDDICVRQNCSYYSQKLQKNSLYNWLEMYRVIQHYTTTNCTVSNTTHSCLNTLFSSGKWDYDTYVAYSMHHLGYPSTPNKTFLRNFNYANSEAYYNKWNNFFTNYNSVEIMDRQACSKTFTRNEFVSEKINLISNLNDIEHSFFIYAAIDTPFDKGEMNKNIFVFEQFGNKIIPVGYLANNPNTPLKFDVITRNPKTFKIEKVNYYKGTEKRPLTFCEAMAYTGDKFSQYCGCKDGNNNLVTQFEKNAACNNVFGCIIRPVKPSSSGWF